nr:MAG TPA: hypothetical protein [Caudoviricetes sp.]
MQVCKHRQRRKCWLVRLAPLRQTLRNRGVFLFLKKSIKIFIKTLAIFEPLQYTKNTTNVRTKEQAMKKLKEPTSAQGLSNGL